MEISERIIEIRKQNSLSQEELAEIVGVSRQAVSKWESNQSIPDIEKIIKISEHFEVTTDYLLKGIKIEQHSKTKRVEKSRVNMMIIVAVSTAVNFFGLILSCFVWYEEKSVMATGIGFIFLTLGFLIYYIGYTLASYEDKNISSKKYWSINIWIFLFIPISLLINLINNEMFAPYPVNLAPISSTILFGLGYVVTCLLVTITCRKKLNDNK